MDGVAWTDAGINNTFDNLDQHEQDFTELIHTYGYNDGVQRIGVDNVEINIFDTVVDFSFSDGQLVPVASQWQQGATPMFYYRTLNDGTNDVTVVCDADGKLYVIENDGYLIKGQNGYAWSIGAAPQALVTNAGGKVTMTAYTDEDETTIISMDGYTVVIDLDGLVTVGEISSLQSPLGYVEVTNPGSSIYMLADTEGKIILLGDGNQSLSKSVSESQNKWNIGEYTGAGETIHVERTYVQTGINFEINGIVCNWNSNNKNVYPAPNQL